MKDIDVLYCYLNPSSFVLKDIEILSSEFKLKLHRFDVQKRAKLPIAFVKQFFFLTKHLFHSKVIIVQFAGYQSYLPVFWSRIFGKKSVLILGGTDCVSFPSINYGNFNSRLLAQFTRYSLRNATLLLPVHETLVKYDYTYQKNDFDKQGFKAFIKYRTSPYRVIFNGFDPNSWNYSSEKSDNFVTIAADLNTRFGYQLKGIDLIFKVADKFPNHNFFIVGGSSIPLKSHPSNVVLMDFMPQKELSEFLADKRYYLQLSMSEGFPNALCEAMLCGCIPIVSKVGAMPMITESLGYILEKKDLKLLESVIKLALNEVKKNELSELIRKKIAMDFPISRRKKELLETIHSLMISVQKD